jgi:alkaline phosphatase D
MRPTFFALLVTAAFAASCSPSEPTAPARTTLVAFGSCAQQDLPQPIWEFVLQAEPDAFLFLGDNVYGDTEDMGVLRRHYAQLAAQPGFQRLKASVPVMATWDDHDFGENDAGNWYPMRDSSQAVFMDFWDVAGDDAMRGRPGVYSARVFGPPGRRLQVILLDTRYFRDRFGLAEAQSEAEADLGYGPYAPTDDTTATMLGDEQWRWLEAQLYEPAEVRLIGSSIQVVGGDHGWESWTMMPHERARLFETVERTGARGVVFLSGDTHWAEISVDTGAPYLLYDITSSALNQEWVQALNLPNRHRVSGAVYPYPNFGLVRVDWKAGEVTLEIRDEAGSPVFGHGVRMDALK